MQTIKVILAESGRVANLKKDFPLYVGSYQNKLLNVLVPKSILAPNFTSHYIDTDGVVKSVDGAYTAVKIGMTYLERTGVIKQSTTFYMRYLKDVIINNIEYSMYERLLPKEFTLFEGQGENAPKLIVNIVNVLVETKIDDENIESIGTTLEIITSQYASIDVMYSADLNNEPEYNPSDMELLSAIVNSHTIDVETSLKNSSDALETSINADNKAVEALSKAEDALNTVVSEKGTSVYVNNQAQLRLDFETDPQTQINNVKKDVATLQTNKAEKTMLSNPNILLNGNFSINTNGLPQYLKGDIVDNWTSSSNSLITRVVDSGLSFTGGIYNRFITQEIKDYKKLLGKTVTISAKIKGVAGHQYKIGLYGNVSDNIDVYLGTYTGNYEVVSYTMNIPNSWTNILAIYYPSLTETDEVFCDYIKLEIGSVATACSPNTLENYLFNNMPSNPNLLINGDFRINQRGQQGKYNFESSSGGYTADRWFAGTLQKITVNEGGSITQTKSLGNTNRWVVQWIENYKQLLGKTITISMKVKDGVSGVTYRLGVYDGTAATIKDGAYSIDGEQIVSVTINVPTTVKNNKLGIILYPYQTYVSGSTEQVSLTVDWVKAELGSVATPFSPRPYAEELALCEWFFKRLIIKGNGNYPIFAIGSIYSATKAFFGTNSNMRIVPTSIFSGGNFVVLANGTEYAITSLGVSSGSTTNGIVIEAKSSGMIAGNSCGLYVNKNREAYIDLDAEIN